jgi:hypothetical protein
LSLTLDLIFHGNLCCLLFIWQIERDNKFYLRLPIVVATFFFLTRDVRASLRAPRLIPGSTEHPVSPIGR